MGVEKVVRLARCAALKERCPRRHNSRVECLKGKVEPLLTLVIVENGAVYGERGIGEPGLRPKVVNV